MTYIQIHLCTYSHALGHTSILHLYKMYWPAKLERRGLSLGFNPGPEPKFRRQVMQEIKKFVDLDVHKSTIAISIAPDAGAKYRPTEMYFPPLACNWGGEYKLRPSKISLLPMRLPIWSKSCAWNWGHSVLLPVHLRVAVQHIYRRTWPCWR